MSSGMKRKSEQLIKIILSGFTNFIVFNTTNGINVYNALLINCNLLSGITSITASGDRAGGSSTPTSSNSSSFSGNIQTREGTVRGKSGSFQVLACAGLITVTVPESRGIYMVLDSDAAGEIDICPDNNQYGFYNNA